MIYYRNLGSIALVYRGLIFAIGIQSKVLTFTFAYGRDVRGPVTFFIVSMFFAWYDFWVGFYLDRKNNYLYLALFPTFIIRFALFNTDS